jgi:hypothetical protein
MDEGITERARRLVDAAETGTVTESLLVGGDEYTGEVFLYGDAPIQRLAAGEQPHAMLFNDMKGVGVGSKRDTVTPEGSARSVFLVTDDRVLLLVGQQDGDWTRSIPLADVTGAAYHTGFMKHRVVVDTRDARYHLWVDASYEERDLEATVALLEAGSEQAGGDATPSTAAEDGRQAGAGRRVGDGRGDGTATANGSRAPTSSPGTDGPPGASGAGVDGGSGAAGDSQDGRPVAGGNGGADGSGTGGGAGAPDGSESEPGADSGSAPSGVEPGADSGSASSGAEPGAGGGDGDGSDPLETLERLKELHEKDVLTDEEFEAKKADLLDQI